MYILIQYNWLIWYCGYNIYYMAKDLWTPDHHVHMCLLNTYSRLSLRSICLFAVIIIYTLIIPTIFWMEGVTGCRKLKKCENPWKKYYIIFLYISLNVVYFPPNSILVNLGCYTYGTTCSSRQHVWSPQRDAHQHADRWRIFLLASQEPIRSQAPASSVRAYCVICSARVVQRAAREGSDKQAGDCYSGKGNHPSV